MQHIQYARRTLPYTVVNAGLDAAACDARPPMCSNHMIDNRPTVDATPSGRLMVTRPEPSKVFKLLADHQSIAPCASHRMPPSLTGPCVSRFAPLPPGLRLEVASAKCQAHDSQGAKNNENDVLHGVIVVLDSCSVSLEFPLLCVGRFWVPELHRLILSCLFHGSSTPVCTASY